MRDLRDLEALVGSPTPIVVIETFEEKRAVELFERLVRTRVHRTLFRWTVTEGLERLDVPQPPQRHNSKPVELLAQIKSTGKPGIYLLLDFHPYLEDPVHVRLLKDIAVAHGEVAHTLVLISHRVSLPAELERFSARFELAFPDTETLERVVREEASAWAKATGARIQTDRRTLERLVRNLSGLPLPDARRLARGAIADDGALTESDLPEVMRAKLELLARDAPLAFTYDTARFAEVGGLDKLKRWLELRASVFAAEKPPPGLDPPRGILLLGVQGCGKSLAAKACAGAWGVPLLALDFGALYNKFYGETERNLRECLRTAEVMAPCVLWVDEIEKAISTDSHDGGTSRRVLGTLLTWMAERRAHVFIVATANDIERLPPELLRKGRMDEIFFVDLPDCEVRARIFAIHLAKREQVPEAFDLAALAAATEGFSGSEIEQAVVSALYAAHAQGGPLATEHVLEAIAQTRPLSVVMAERIAHLRHWARTRTVLA